MRQIWSRNSSVLPELLDDLPGHGEMESPDFLPSGDDLLGGENEPVVAGVPQLHGKAGEGGAGAMSVAPVGDAGLAQGPIQGAATCWIQHAGNATNLIHVSLFFVHIIWRIHKFQFEACIIFRVWVPHETPFQ